MKKFICISCGKYWYSSHDDSEPCQRCMGKLLEVPMNRRDLEMFEAMPTITAKEENEYD